MEPVRLLIFLNSSVRGGVEEVALSLAKGLARREFEVYLAAPAPLLESFRPDLVGCPVHTLAIRLNSFRQIRQLGQFVKFLRGRRIQIVNSHLFYATLFAAPLARLAGVAAVVETTHGPEAWRTSWWKRRNWLDRLVARFVTLHVAVSEANRRYLEQVKGYPPHKLRVVPNGRAPDSDVSGEEVERLRAELGLQPSDRILVVVGRLEEQKGHRYLFEAIPAILRHEPRTRFLLVGDGSLRGELERMARDGGFQPAAIFTGFRPRVAPFYRLAEFVVLPSVYEGMPLVAIEAGAAGRAMVATKVDGTEEVLVDGETGLLVPPRSAEHLVSAIRRLLDNPQETRRMGQQACRHVQDRFTLDRQIARTSTLYLDCLRGKLLPVTVP